MVRIICDSYIKGEKQTWGTDKADEFNRRILAINNMYGWLYQKGILEKVSFQWKDYKAGTYFAFDAKDLAPYRAQMESCGLPDAALAVQHIFDQEYSPCHYSGAIQLSWSMSSYRSVDGCVGRSWECGLIQGLNVPAIYGIQGVLESQGPKAAITAAFATYDWRPSDIVKESSLDNKIQKANGKRKHSDERPLETSQDR